MPCQQGKRGGSQAEDQILLHEPLREVPRSRPQAMETPAAAHQNSHHHHPGKPRVVKYMKYALRPVCEHRHSPPPAGVVWPEQPDGGQIQGGEPDDLQAPLPQRLC